jgi:hypothetical protein
MTFDIEFESLIILLIKYGGACPPCKGRLMVAAEEDFNPKSKNGYLV